MVKKLIAMLIMMGAIAGGILIHIEITNAAEMNFSVSAVLPENQIDKSNTYFELRMKPGQEQVLEVMLNNRLDRAVTVETHANTAITNDNGTVDFSNATPKIDTTLKYPFSHIAKTPTEITIPAKSNKTMKVKVTMPSTPYEGMILGGLHFTEKETAKNGATDSQNGVQTKDENEYVIGVFLTENDRVVEPEMQLNKISPSQVDYHNVLKANLQNTKSVIIPNLEVSADVYRENSDKVLYNEKLTGLRMAPNSNFNFGIGWDNQKFKPGKYRLKMIATSGKNIWKWDEAFEIKSDVAAELNDKAVELEADEMMWYMISGSLIVVSLVGLVFLLGRRLKKGHKNNLL
ncbi:DUF916 and DUF3324 domain-containing protein [Listeria grandensis]|uniref:DUF916 and DUF3324 domain-containing protein n=1 Tax=Listeria grandensis TaxID=1494963 RepID=UPI00164EBC90|nr:DUF916 and DUF3324 domain-containing protein [Listeria grandensis]MBC6315750.1 DUF916 and DUF3324 domain-containing protein [Listeria grandensis]